MTKATKRSQNPALAGSGGCGEVVRDGALGGGGSSAVGGVAVSAVLLSRDWEDSIPGVSGKVWSFIAAACYGILQRYGKGGISLSSHKQRQSAAAMIPAVSARKVCVPRLTM